MYHGRVVHIHFEVALLLLFPVSLFSRWNTPTTLSWSLVTARLWLIPPTFPILTGSSPRLNTYDDDNPRAIQKPERGCASTAHTLQQPARHTASRGRLVRQKWLCDVGGVMRSPTHTPAVILPRNQLRSQFELIIPLPTYLGDGGCRSRRS